MRVANFCFIDKIIEKYEGDVNMEFDLIHNAMHSFNEAIGYYVAGKNNDIPDLFKFSILLVSHCAEL